MDRKTDKYNRVAAGGRDGADPSFSCALGSFSMLSKPGNWKLETPLRGA